MLVLVALLRFGSPLEKGRSSEFSLIIRENPVQGKLLQFILLLVWRTYFILEKYFTHTK